MFVGYLRTYFSLWTTLLMDIMYVCRLMIVHTSVPYLCSRERSCHVTLPYSIKIQVSVLIYTFLKVVAYI